MEVGIKTYYFWKPHPYYRKFPRFRCLHIILCSSLVDWHLLIDSFLILFLLIVFHNLLLLQLMLLYLAVSPFHVSSLTVGGRSYLSNCCCGGHVGDVPVSSVLGRKLFCLNCGKVFSSFTSSMRTFEVCLLTYDKVWSKFQHSHACLNITHIPSVRILIPKPHYNDFYNLNYGVML